MARPKTETNSDFPWIGRPAAQALEAAGITRMDQLTQMTEEELLKLHGMGPKALGILRSALSAEGKSFAERSKG